MTPASAYDWESILDGAGWFHTTGITPALSEASAEATIKSVKRAGRPDGLLRSEFPQKAMDGTYLSSKELAGETMRRLLPYADVIIGNEDASDVLGINAENTDVHSGKMTQANTLRSPVKL